MLGDSFRYLFFLNVHPLEFESYFSDGLNQLSVVWIPENSFLKKELLLLSYPIRSPNRRDAKTPSIYHSPPGNFHIPPLEKEVDSKVPAIVRDM